MQYTLPTDSAERKEVPLLSGLFRYFPAALAAVARVSKRGNDKHNPGEEMHHARGKSMDHGDCILRHTMDVEDLKARIARMPGNETDGGEGVRLLLDEAAQRAWRSLAELQELCEKHAGAPLAPGARVESNATGSFQQGLDAVVQAGVQTLDKRIIDDVIDTRWSPSTGSMEQAKKRDEEFKKRLAALELAEHQAKYT